MPNYDRHGSVHEHIARMSYTVPMLDETTLPNSGQPPQKRGFNDLPDEIKITILRYAFNVSRITPMYAHLFGNRSLIRCCARVDKKMYGIAKETYYGDNTLIVQRQYLLGAYRNDEKAPTATAMNSIIRVPNTSVARWVRRLEMRLTIEETQKWESDWLGQARYEDLQREGPLAIQMQRDLGVLLRPRDDFGYRTVWQENLTALKELRVVFTYKDHAICSFKNLSKDLAKHFAIDLKQERVEVLVETRTSDENMPHECRSLHDYRLAAEHLACAIKALVKLRSCGNVVTAY
ncbi:hypothetical protein CC86DRAFT_383515 [Ophiobolus disseminans]|uniref:F-box domain-containing protein n=1 Tax=Ophiobolus disseminans TaxID=1469910 RepID=A0A6A6ZWL9_9PLEO|nr:hypothetical protein CC86DRAFT_383515 [Ophiobolus disseminans]